MTPELYRRLECLFIEARELSPEGRCAFLGEVSRRDPELGRELDRLLRHDDEPEQFGDLLAQGAGARVLAGVLAEHPTSPPARNGRGAEAPELPRQIGRYKILGLIGHGGMGAVYEAEQVDPKRRVALKVIRDGFGSAQAAERFHREAQMLGRLRHRGIAQIYDAHTSPGAIDPPYFVMELVNGPTLLRFAEVARLDLRQRLELMAEVCDALDHAHQNGLIHRDLKPGNILVEPRVAAGTGSASSSLDSIEARVGGQPKILDFGVARSTDVTTLTDLQPGRLVGTIPYMSPEQAGGAGMDRRSDVYSAGVILFELLSGQLPYDLSGKMIHEAARIIRDEEPKRLGSIDRRLRGDVEVIAAKALEKDCGCRYASAAELASDIRRYLCDQPIVARPPTSWYRLRKLASRKRPVVVSIGVAAAAVLVAAIITTAQVRAARSAAMAAEQQRSVADAERWRAYVGAIAGAAVAIDNHNPATAAEFVSVVGGHDTWEYRHVTGRMRAYGSTIEVDSPVVAAMFERDGGMLVTASRAGLIQWWDPDTRELRRTVALAQQITGPAAFSRSGDRLAATVGPDADSVAVFDCTNSAELGRLGGAEIAAAFHRPKGGGGRGDAATRHADGRREQRGVWPVTAVAIAPDGELVAVGASGGMLWRPKTGERWGWLLNLDLRSMEFSNDGKRLVGGYLDPRVENIGLVNALDTLAEVREHINIPVTSVLPMPAAAAPDKYRTIGEGESATRLVLFEMGSKNRAFGDSTLRITAVGFDPGTPRIAIATVDRLIRVYGGRSRRLKRDLAGPGGEVNVLAFSEDGTRMLAAAGRVVQTYQTKPIDAEAVLAIVAAPGTPLAWESDSQLVMVGADDRLMRWSPASAEDIAGALSTPEREPTTAMAISGPMLIAGYESGEVRMRDTRSGEAVWSVFEDGGDPAVALAAASGPGLVAVRTSKLLEVRDGASGDRRWTTPLGVGTDGRGAIALSGDGSQLAAVDGDRVRVFETAGGRPVGELRHASLVFTSVAFSPDGQTVAAGASTGDLCAWDLKTGMERAHAAGHAGAVRAAEFSPSEPRLATGSEDRTVIVWDTARWEPVLTLPGRGGAIAALRFSPEGSKLASSTDDGVVREWEAPAPAR